MWTLGPVRRTSRERLALGPDGGREFVDSVRSARLHDDDDIYIYIYIYMSRSFPSSLSLSLSLSLSTSYAPSHMYCRLVMSDLHRYTLKLQAYKHTTHWSDKGKNILFRNKTSDVHAFVCRFRLKGEGRRTGWVTRLRRELSIGTLCFVFYLNLVTACRNTSIFWLLSFLVRFC